ncbi:hypothetical protein PROFUN_05508 [Planoprotostelium fungivorum]|uniref:Protein phosphatase n=1 Tax=Planoprotostelium fungivorum TaxID=1890364 RepID=A0A2P6NQX9_9EUKA|nr:hypothetical protein PROFUN_05508 [Planoprotostelium fungivorum]
MSTATDTVNTTEVTLPRPLAAPRSVLSPLFGLFLVAQTQNIFSSKSSQEVENMANVPEATMEDADSSDMFENEAPDTTPDTINTVQPTSDGSETADSVGRSNTQSQPPQKYIFQSGASAIAHPNKQDKGGEDAYFICPSAFGVADGVGGWNEIGIDPSLYSRKLMEGAQLSVMNEPPQTPPVVTLRNAYDHVTYHNIIGSTTACIVKLEGDNLRAANLGDSGFLIVRNGQVIYRTKEQQFSFNFPYQIGTNSDCLPESHAEDITLQIQPNDIVVAGSDGLFDNLYDQEIVEILRNCTDDAQEAAEKIAHMACKMSREWTRLSPFAKQAHNHGLIFVYGGKVDDITVVVGIAGDVYVLAYSFGSQMKRTEVGSFI